ncbi:MAG: hypothetical protein H5T61_15985 [Thermoflexales bacterium]|nr:hypothetical protein [Thermoflexales bacterium]
MMPPAAEWSTVIVSIIYLIGAWTVTVLMVLALRRVSPETRSVLKWPFLAVLILAFGDSFHTIPRIYRTISGHTLPTLLAWFGRQWDWIALGLVISSATMSLFYLFLFQYRQERRGVRWDFWSWLMLGLLVVRLGLLPCPLNGWEGSAAPGWRIYRNIPFTLMGLIVVLALFRDRSEVTGRDRRLLEAIAWCLVVSFATYWVTVLGAEQYPVLGAMMLPKTIAYLVAVILLYRLAFAQPTEATA